MTSSLAAAFPPLEPASEPMAPVDVAWLRMDEPNNLMQINGVIVFDGSVDFGRIRELVAARLGRIRRFRQRVVDEGGRFTWREARDFDIDNHLVLETLPEPGGKAGLQRLISELMSQPLDRAHPLWKFHIVENYEGGTAVFGRLHHAIGDGVALMLVILSLCDLAPKGPPAAEAVDETPEPLPGELADLFGRPLDSLAAFRRLAEEVMPDTMRLLMHPVEAMRQTSAVLRGAAAVGSFGRLVTYPPDARTKFKGPLVLEKLADWTEPIDVEEVKKIGRGLGGTINDVLLTATAGALRRYLVRHGEPEESLSVRAVVPVNLRPIEKMSELGNRFGLVFLGLPVGIPDPIRRLAELRRRAEALKRSAQPLVAYGILHAMGLSPLAVQKLVVRMFGSKATAVMTNVPGPRRVLYFAGRPIEDLFFWVPQSGRLGLGVAICSYRGRARVGFATDAGLVPDPQEIIRGFHDEYAELRSRVNLD